MDEYSTVSLNQYWSTIGIPYFFIVIVFCLFVLFNISGSALSSRDEILKFMAELKERKPHYRGGPGAAAAGPSNGRSIGSSRGSAFAPPSK